MRNSGLKCAHCVIVMHPRGSLEGFSSYKVEIWIFEKFFVHTIKYSDMTKVLPKPGLNNLYFTCRLISFAILISLQYYFILIEFNILNLMKNGRRGKGIP